jgi:predicted RNA-binding protein with PIN domain
LGKNSKNKITVVFDGYPQVSAQNLAETDINVVFSREETADARIKKMV